MRLAATSTPNPNHPATWGGFFAMLIVMAGCAVIFVGLLASFATWRSTEQPRHPGQWRVLFGTAGCFTVVGLAIIALGVWLY